MIDFLLGVPGISGASAPASLKQRRRLAWNRRRQRISGASAPASLKPHQHAGRLQPRQVWYFRGIRPGLIEALVLLSWQRVWPPVFPGHPPRPH